MIISGFYQLINELDQNEGKRPTLDNYFVLQHRVYIPLYSQILVYSQIYKWQSVVDILEAYEYICNIYMHINKFVYDF